jgi:septal ring factor EnvC (AmiA/AmiB activator)
VAARKGLAAGAAGEGQSAAIARHKNCRNLPGESAGRASSASDRLAPATKGTRVIRIRSANAWILATLPLAVLAAACLSASMVHAQSKDDVRHKLEKNRQQLDEAQKRGQGLEADMGQIKADRERLNASLVDTARQVQKSEGQMSTIESRLGELESQETMLRGSLAQRHDSIARLLAAMQRMGRNPPPVMITRREDALTMVRSAMMLANAFPQLRDQALSLATRQNELARVMADIRTEGDKLKAETTRLNDTRTRLAQLMESKKQSLSERQLELEKVRKEAAEISQNVADLNDLIVKLDKAVTDHIGKDAAPAEGVKGSDGLEVAALPDSKLALPGSAVTSSQDAGVKSAGMAAIELAPKGTQIASLNPGRMKPAMPFIRAKGSVLLPVQGRRVLAFGDRTQYGGQSKGLVLETRHSAQVTSPCDGWIVFAGEFRTFGQLLIINAGDGYHILLAGLSQIDVQLGQFVLTGEPVGLMATAPKAAKANTQGNAPVLYIEFRKENKPIDPESWWAAGPQKVQG